MRDFKHIPEQASPQADDDAKIRRCVGAVQTGDTAINEILLALNSDGRFGVGEIKGLKVNTIVAGMANDADATETAVQLKLGWKIKPRDEAARVRNALFVLLAGEMVRLVLPRFVDQLKIALGANKFLGAEPNGIPLVSPRCGSSFW